MKNLGAFLAKRLAFTIFAAWLLFTVMFAIVFKTEDPNVIAAALGGFGNPDVDAAEMQTAYLEAQGRNASTLELYRDWLVSFATFDFGYSTHQGESINALITDGVLITSVYVLPALVVSTIASVCLGYYSALRDGARSEGVVRLVVYASAAVPAFLFAAIAFTVLVNDFQWYSAFYDDDLSVFSRQNLQTLSVPSIVLALSLFGAQTRYVRTQTRKYEGMEFTKMARSKGAGPLRIARHVLRNAALPLVSITFTELLSIFVLSVFVVEIIFSIPGVGLLGYEAIQDRDFGLVVVTMLVPMLLALVGNLLQDLAYAHFDPRVDLE